MQRAESASPGRLHLAARSLRPRFRDKERVGKLSPCEIQVSFPFPLTWPLIREGGEAGSAPPPPVGLLSPPLIPVAGQGSEGPEGLGPGAHEPGPLREGPAGRLRPEAGLLF